MYNINYIDIKRSDLINVLGILTFMSIVETKSLSKAATSLHIAQSSVSHRLKSLEDELGIQLIERKQGQRYIELTNKGEEFVSIAEKLVSLNRDIKYLQTSEPHSSLSIGCVETLNSVVFPTFYKRLVEETPNLALDISTHWSYVIYNLLEAHDIDVGFVLNQIKAKNVLCEPVFNERMVMIYNKNFVEYPPEVHPSKLESNKQVLLSWSPSYQNWYDYWFAQSKKAFVKVDSSSLIISFILTSDLWTIVPISLARAFRKIHDIGISEIADPPPDRVCYKITHRYPNPGRIKSIENFNRTLDDFKSDKNFLSLIK